MDRDRALALGEQLLGLPGREWAPTRSASVAGLVSAALLLPALLLLGPLARETTLADPAGIASVTLLTAVAVALPVPLGTRVRTHLVLDGGALTLLITCWGPTRAVACWLVVTLALELVRKHFVAMALVNTVVVTTAAAAAALVAHLVLGDPGQVLQDSPAHLLLGCAASGLAYALGTGVLTSLLAEVLDPGPSERPGPRTAAAVLLLATTPSVFAALCTYPPRLAAGTLALAVPMLLLIALARTDRTRHVTVARDGAVLDAVTELARADDLTRIEALRAAAADAVTTTVTLTVEEGRPARDPASRLLELGPDRLPADPTRELPRRWLRVTRSPHDVTVPHDELAALTTIAAVSRAAADRVVEHRRTLWRAEHDPLTGLLNRDGLLARARARADGVAGVLVVDLDDFKAANDLAGHDGGDAVLVASAHAIRECAPPDAAVARWGGDEFVVHLPGPRPATELDLLGHRIIQAVEQAGTRALTRPLVSASVGHACGPLDLPVLLAAADRSLYAAKHAGKATVRGG